MNEKPPSTERKEFNERAQDTSPSDGTAGLGGKQIRTTVPEALALFIIPLRDSLRPPHREMKISNLAHRF